MTELKRNSVSLNTGVEGLVGHPALPGGGRG